MLLVWRDLACVSYAAQAEEEVDDDTYQGLLRDYGVRVNEAESVREKKKKSDNLLVHVNLLDRT